MVYVETCPCETQFATSDALAPSKLLSMAVVMVVVQVVVVEYS